MENYELALYYHQRLRYQMNLKTRLDIIIAALYANLGEYTKAIDIMSRIEPKPKWSRYNFFLLIIQIYSKVEQYHIAIQLYPLYKPQS
jgi:hypothetical protein